MSKITQEAINAFIQGWKFRKSNTVVTNYFHYEGNEGISEIKLYLYGKCIASHRMIDFISRPIEISNAGCFSNTTKERLNGIPGVSISQKKGLWYLNGKEWNGTWITIS